MRSKARVPLAAAIIAVIVWATGVLGTDQPAEAATASCAAGSTCDTIVLVTEDAHFHVLDDAVSSSAQAGSFAYGNAGDVPLLGDWDCDGVDTPAMYRPSNGFAYLRNSPTQGVADFSYFYGDPSDVPVAGDFDGDGCDTLAVYRPAEGKFYIKDTLGTGMADYSFYFGNPWDTPFVGDFDGDGVDTMGLHRSETGFAYLRNSNSDGIADLAFYYGNPGDEITAGDWNGDGRDSVAVYRPSTQTLYVKLQNSQGTADHEREVGRYAHVLSGEVPVPVGSAASVPGGRSVQPTGSGLLWSAGMETGNLDEWDSGGGEYNSGGGDAWASQDIAGSGQWSAKLVLDDGSGGTRLFRWGEPRQHPEAYYSAWFYFPTQFEPDSWWNIFQYKSKISSSINDPFWVINVGNRADGAMHLYLWDWQNQQGYDQTAIDLPTNQWVHIECFLSQSATASGQLTCWQDGVLLWDFLNVSTRYPDGDNQWSINSYSSGVSPAPVAIYVDDAAISLTSTWPGQ